MALKTADYDLHHLDNVYEPCEDSYLFLDALEKDLIHLEALKPQMIVEIGCGSGIIITSLAKTLTGCNYFAVDINSAACAATQKTAQLNQVSVEVCNMDLLSHFKPRLFDVVLFNPPYVVTESEEIMGRGLSRAWAGGADGRQIIDALLPKIANILSDKGVFYLLLVMENKPKDVVAVMAGFGFKHAFIIERYIIGEHLFVIKFFR